MLRISNMLRNVPFPTYGQESKILLTLLKMTEKIDLEGEEIIPREIEEEMKQSYVDYAMSVIVGRALPDVRDGLKPVHRRILFAMNDMGMLHNKPFKKSARIVGEVLGKYHPHGDSAVYESMVRMAQDWSLRYPLIDGQGNFGSIDGDSAAAMRYSEARLKNLSEELLQDIDKNTVKFRPNFDASLEEPIVLPSKVPNLLINGSSGIAVGMATNIPPHNMGEVVDGTIALIDDPELKLDELMKHIKGPDFPTGGIICGREGILSAYSTGRGKVVVRAKTEIQPEKNRLVITEIPYMVNKAEMIKQMAALVNDGKIIGISDIRDESDREGMSVIIELRKDANANVVLNQLYKHTRLQDTFGIIMVALVNDEPKLLGIKPIIMYFIEHRKEVVRKRIEFDLEKAKDRAHILEGLVVALQDIDRTVKLIKQSNSVQEARESLISNLSISEKQAAAILDMKLQKLAALEQEKIKTEYSGLMKLIEELNIILASEQKILDIIKDELLELKKKYGDDRRSEISFNEAEMFETQDLIKQEKMVITVTHSGYIKRQPLDTYKQQKRGGKGIIAAGTKEQDFVEDIFVANTHSSILFFTDKGRIHWLKVYSVPEGSRQALGKSIVNLLQLGQDEKISAFIPVSEFKEGLFLIMATKKGTVKKTDLMSYSNPRKGGIIAITLEEGDELIRVVKTDGNEQIMLATKNGSAVRFREGDVRPTGRSAKGVRGATLREGDEVIDIVVADDTKTLLTITENGFGKRTNVSEYRLARRGGVGVRNIVCSERNGSVVAVRSVNPGDEIMFISKFGITIRTPADGISVISRSTQGMTLMKLSEGDKVVAAAKIIKEESDDEVLDNDEVDSDDDKDLVQGEIENQSEGEGQIEDKTSVNEEIEDKTEPEEKEIEDKSEVKKEIEDQSEESEQIENQTEEEEQIEDKTLVNEEIEDKTEPEEKEIEDKTEEEKQIENQAEEEEQIEDKTEPEEKEIEDNSEVKKEIEDNSEEENKLEDNPLINEEIEDNTSEVKQIEVQGDVMLDIVDKIDSMELPDLDRK